MAIDAEAARGRDAFVALMASDESNPGTIRLMFDGPEIAAALARVIGPGHRLPAETLAEVFGTLARS